MPGRRHDPDRDCQTERLGRTVDVGELRPGADVDEPRLRLHVDRVELAQVEHDAVVDRAVAGDVVAAAADRQRQAGFAGRRR